VLLLRQLAGMHLGLHFIVLASCKPGRKRGRKHVESQLRTCLKRVFSTLHLSRTRTNQRSEPAAVRDRVLDKKVESWSKECLKPVRTCRKAGCKPGRKPGLQPGWQLVRIMECSLYCALVATDGVDRSRAS